MKMFGRRIFAKSMPAAPLAAGMIVRGLDQNGAQVVEKYPTGGIPFDLTRVAEPPRLKEYYATLEQGHKAFRFFDNRRDLQRHQDRAISPNIACLRSVSTQHKYIMHMREVDRIREENRSFTEKMMDVFGVRDYFNKIQYRNDGCATASDDSY